MHIATAGLGLAFTLLALIPDTLANSAIHSRRGCRPFHADFTAPNPQGAFDSGFSLVDGSYAFTNRGLELYLNKPAGQVTTSNGTNDKVGWGTTINSTVPFRTGKATFEVSSPLISGLVVAGILIGTDTADEIDIEFVCAQHKTWQTNLFVEPPNSPPEYNLGFSTKEPVDSIDQVHSYSIDMNDARIQWSLDGRVFRVLNKENCMRNGYMHYPTHEMRLQLGIWDASGPSRSTASWADGPVDWEHAPDRVSAIVRSVTVEC